MRGFYFENQYFFCFNPLHQSSLLNLSLHKIPQFHLISRCRNFAEAHTASARFRAIRPKLYENFVHSRKLGEISVFYGVFYIIRVFENLLIKMFQFLEDYLLILTSLEAVVAHRCLRNKAIAFTEGYLGPCQTFPVFGLNTERYFVSLCIQSKLGKIRTGITPNTDSFNVVLVLRKNDRKLMRLFCSPDFHSVKNQNFRKLTGVKILWKCAVSAEFRIN